MFGRNILIKPAYKDAYDGTYNVIGIFHTIQGEGPFSGEPAVFIRLAGCNLRCHFCDTDFESGAKQARLEEVIAEVIQQADTTTKLVVLTGGEPLAQPVRPLCEALVAAGFHVQIETAGTVWQEGLEFLAIGSGLTVVCSPKTGTVHPQLARACRHWKYIIRKGEGGAMDGLPVMSTQDPAKRMELYRPSFRHDPEMDVVGPNIVWVSPCDEYLNGSSLLRDEVKYKENVGECVRLALNYGYRVSLQTHKYMGVE